jgi:integrase/recombinase XerD
LERGKTERSTRANPKPIFIYINEDLWRNINRRGNKDKDPNNFIFPILEAGQSLQQQYDTRQLSIAFINNWMRKIGEKENIEKKTTT